MPTLVREVPRTLLAMAERGHGVAVIASAFQTDRHTLRIVGLTYRGRPLREARGLLGQAATPARATLQAFCEMLAEHMS
jgi:hypothetical protein